MAPRKQKGDKREGDPAPSEPPPPLIPITTSQFDRDVDLMKKRGKDMAALRAVADLIIHRRPLDRRHRDHSLKGQWKGCRECHVKDDWVVVYEVRGPEVHFHRTGTHSDMGW